MLSDKQPISHVRQHSCISYLEKRGSEIVSYNCRNECKTGLQHGFSADFATRLN